MSDHAILGGSSAARWMGCPGSVRLSAQVPEGPTSRYAIEGTAAHEIAARCVEKDVDPDLFLDTILEIEGELVTVDEEMVEAAGVVRDVVNRRIEEGYELVGVEQRFDLAELNPPAPMYGTADVVLFKPAVPARKVRDGVTVPKPSYLDVIDLKYGRGVVVEALNNKQLMYYALGAILTVRKRADYVRLTIIQPRAGHPDGIVRDAEYSWQDVVDFKEELLAAARKTQEPGAELVMGPYCNFCPALAICPAQHAKAQETARNTFEVVAVEQSQDLFPVPEALNLEQLREVMDAAPAIQDWLRAVQRHVHTLTEAGEDTGYKLVAKRGRRLWNDEAEAERFLRSIVGDDAFSRKLCSPAQAEKVLRAAGRNKSDIADLWSMVSSGTNLAPLEDPRPAIDPNQEAARLFAPVETEGEET